MVTSIRTELKRTKKKNKKGNEQKSNMRQNQQSQERQGLSWRVVVLCGLLFDSQLAGGGVFGHPLPPFVSCQVFSLSLETNRPDRQTHTERYCTVERNPGLMHPAKYLGLCSYFALWPSGFGNLPSHPSSTPSQGKTQRALCCRMTGQLIPSNGGTKFLSFLVV